MSYDLVRRRANCGRQLHAIGRKEADRKWRVYLALIGLFGVAACDGLVPIANAFTVEVDASSARVLIEARNVQIDDILGELAAAKGFAIDRPDSDARNRPWSGRFEGPLDDAIGRLLAGENYIIEHSKLAHGGIERLRLFESDRSEQVEDGAVRQNQPIHQQPYNPQSAPIASAPQPAPAVRTRSSRSIPSNAQLQHEPPQRAPAAVANSAPVNQAAGGMRRRGGVIQ